MSASDGNPRTELKEKLRQLDQIRPDQIPVETMRGMQKTIHARY